MKQRQRRRLIIKRMGMLTLSFGYEGMYHTRQIKPCESYSSWCSDCNAVLFRQTKGRFPYAWAEFMAFEYEQQKGQYD